MLSTCFSMKQIWEISIVGKILTLLNTFACKGIQRYNMPPFVTMDKVEQRDKSIGRVNMMVVAMALDFNSSCLRGNDYHWEKVEPIGDTFFCWRI